MKSANQWVCSVHQLLAEEIGKRGFKVHDDVGGLSQEGSIRRIAILAICQSRKRGYIIDPTIRFEQNQPEAVHKEK